MTKALPLAITAAALALTGCATTDYATDIDGACEAEPGQSFVGQKATAETGAALLKATRARQLRWAPPRSALTMDFRPDRLTVSYDDDMIIRMVNCG